MPQSQSNIYKELSADMRDSLKQIYRQIASASTEEDSVAAKSEALFTEASDQLNEVVKATENAAMDIMDIVEKQLEQTEADGELLKELDGKIPAKTLARLRQSNARLAADLTSVLTALSFQDITGQRIKKVMSALAAIENSVVDLYLSSGLAMDAAEKNPGKSAQAIKSDTRKAMEEYAEGKKSASELKGPASTPVSQRAIDDMLAQLGL